MPTGRQIQRVMQAETETAEQLVGRLRQRYGNSLIDQAEEYVESLGVKPGEFNFAGKVEEAAQNISEGNAVPKAKLADSVGQRLDDMLSSKPPAALTAGERAQSSNPWDQSNVPPVITPGRAKKAAVAAGLGGAAMAAGAAGSMYEPDATPPEAAPPKAKPPMTPAEESAPSAGAGGGGPSLGSVTARDLGTLDLEEQPEAADYGVSREDQPDFEESRARRAEIREQYKDARLELQREQNEAAQAFRGAKSDLERREIFEHIIRGMSYLAAAWAGAKVGAPVNNLEIPRTDFGEKHRQALADHAQAIREASERHAARKEELEAAGRDVQEDEAATQRAWQNNLALFQSALEQTKARNSDLLHAWQASAENEKMRMQGQDNAERLRLAWAEHSIKAKYYDSMGDRNQAKTEKDKQRVIQDIYAAVGKAKAAKSEDQAQGELIKARGLHERYKELTGESLLPGNVLNSVEVDDWDKAFKGIEGSAGSGSTEAPSGEGPGSNEKLINGVRYRKVNGGWQRVPNA